jgi:hypothetical protein
LAARHQASMWLSSTAESGKTFVDIDDLTQGFHAPPNVTDTRL